MKQLIIISDWVNDTLRQQEFKSTVVGFVKGDHSPLISFVSSSPSSIHASFLAQQVVATEERYGKPLETIILLDLIAKEISDGADSLPEVNQFACLRLTSGLMVIGYNRGYSFALLTDRLDKVFTYPFEGRKGTFVARDQYAKFAAHLIDEMADDLELEEIALHTIPRLSGCHVGHMDINGAIKTTVKVSQITSKYSVEQEVPISIGTYTCLARYLHDTVDGITESIFYPGSSGDPHDPYMELLPQGRQIQYLPRYVMRINDVFIKPGMRVTIPDVC